MNNLKSQEYFQHRPTSTQYVVEDISTVLPSTLAQNT